MNDREKTLALAVGAMVLLWAANIGWTRYQSALQANQNNQTQVAQELSEAKTAVLRGRRAQSRLRKWNKQSLPTDPDLARALYQDWLREQLSTAGITVKNLDVSMPRSSSKSYQQFTFTVSASGDLEQFTAFLYKFYQAKHLHRLSQTTLSPVDDRGTLNITLKVDALALPNADRADQLASGSLDAFDQSVDEFQALIGERDIFSVYQPPKPPEQPAEEVAEAPPEDDEAEQAMFSGIHYGDDGWLMLISMQDSGELLYFREGDEIQIGQFSGIIEQLDGSRRRAVISTKTGQVEVRFGKTLAKARPLDAQAS